MNNASTILNVETNRITATSDIRLTRYPRKVEVKDGRLVLSGNLEWCRSQKRACDIASDVYPQVSCDLLNARGEVMYTIDNCIDLRDFFLTGFGSFLVRMEELDQLVKLNQARKVIIYVTLRYKRSLISW